MVVLSFLPELKEGEDEKIRKDIVTYLAQSANSATLKVNAQKFNKWISWLEKQDQKETTWNKEDEENMNNVLYILNQLKDTSFYKEDDIAGKAINWFKYLKDRLCSNNEYDKDMLGAIEYCKKNNRPLEKEHLAWIEKQGEQNLADKIEPKFKVGDWVVFNNKHQSIYQVEKVENGYYILRHTHGGTFRICVLHDESLRLWSIQDAKMVMCLLAMKKFYYSNHIQYKVASLYTVGITVKQIISIVKK